MSEQDPFEAIGPAATPHKKLTLTDRLKGAVRATSDFLQRPDVSRIRDISADMFEILAEVDSKNPLSVAAAGVHLVTLASDHLSEVSPWTPLQIRWNEDVSQKEGARIWLDMHLAYHFLPLVPADQVHVHFDPGFKKKKKIGSNLPDTVERIYTVHIAEGVQAFWTANSVVLSDPREQILGIPTITGWDQEENLVDSYDLIRDTLWDRYEAHIEFWWDAKKEDIQFKTRQDPPWGYKGDRGLELIEGWRKFLDKGLRRAVVLHGLPGNGKSTLAREAAKRLGKRTLYLPLQTLESIPLNILSQTVAILSPQVLIVDDLDRLGSSRLERLLFLFEENGSDMSAVPMIIATTNSIERLPPALRRPGRFDEVWQIDPPDDDMMRDLVAYLAIEEGLDLPENDLEAIILFCQERTLSGAHVREILRRVLVHGLVALEIDPTDLTFSSQFFQDESSDYTKKGYHDCNEDYEDEDEDEDDYEDYADEEDCAYSQTSARGTTNDARCYPSRSYNPRKGK